MELQSTIMKKIDYSKPHFTDYIGVLPSMNVTPWCDIQAPELFFCLFPVAIGDIVKAYVVAPYSSTYGTQIVHPIGTMYPQSHPSLSGGIDPDELHSIVLATGRLSFSDSSITFSSVQAEIGYGEYEGLLPYKLQEAGDAIFTRCYEEQHFSSVWISGRRFRTTTLCLEDNFDPHPPFRSVEALGSPQMSAQLKQSDDQAAISSIASKFRKADFE